MLRPSNQSDVHGMNTFPFGCYNGTMTMCQNTHPPYLKQSAFTVPVKLPLREILEAGEAPLDPPFGDPPLDPPFGDPPRGEGPLGDRPRGEDAPRRKTSLSAGSGMEANRAEVNTWVGCRKAPPRPLTTRCSGSKGWRLDCPGGWGGGMPAWCS